MANEKLQSNSQANKKAFATRFSINQSIEFFYVFVLTFG